jgi:hypothetical protein
VGSHEFIKISGLKWAGQVVRMEDSCPANDCVRWPQKEETTKDSHCGQDAKIVGERNWKAIATMNRGKLVKTSPETQGS